MAGATRNIYTAVWWKLYFEATMDYGCISPSEARRHPAVRAAIVGILHEARLHSSESESGTSHKM